MQPRLALQTSQTPPRTRHGAGPLCKWIATALGALSLLVAGVRSTAIRAQDDEPAEVREYRIKAAYLYQFGRYIEWPAQAFRDPKSPFVIGVMKGDPIIAHLNQIAETKKIQERPIRIEQFSTPDDVRPCHILFLSASLGEEMQAAVVRRQPDRGVLLVGEMERFLALGGIIRFVVEDNTVRIHIARKAAQREGLTVSAKLLQVAHVVD
jgi:hypothetical protein